MKSFRIIPLFVLLIPATGQELWRRKDVSLDETDVAPVPGTDLLLISFEREIKHGLKQRIL